MSDNTRLTESLADIQSKLTRLTWEVMDEEQRDEVMHKVVVPRWGKTTRDGHTLKGTLWAEILGTTEEVIKSRYKRICASIAEQNRRSESVSEGAGPGLTETQKSEVRKARAVTRDPVRVKQLVSDPEVRAALKEAMGDGPDLEAQRAAANTARREEQEKAATERRELIEAQRIEREQAVAVEREKLKHIEELLRAEIKAEPPTPEVLAAMASQALTSSDPEIVSKMAEAYGQHRVEQDARNASDARERAAAARAARAEQDATNATRRASAEYEDSALKLFLDATEILQEANTLLSRKPITFSNVIASGLTVGELEDKVEEAVEASKRVEASVLEATVQGDSVIQR